MVDSIKGIGPVQGNQTQSANKSQSSAREEKPSSLSSQGEVELDISSEGLSLAQAETTARNARTQLENNDQTLSTGKGLEGLLAYQG